jgi:hypothetical protein
MSAFWMELILTIEAEPFDAFAVHPAGVAVYHLGNNGTARKLLKAWPVQTPEWPALKRPPPPSSHSWAARTARTWVRRPWAGRGAA